MPAAAARPSVSPGVSFTDVTNERGVGPYCVIIVKSRKKKWFQLFVIGPEWNKLYVPVVAADDAH